MPTITSATRDESRILYLDGWRGCAILAVLFGHFGTSEGLGLGALGVELFFVLSGRLMAEILFERQSPLGLFFLRRISRVWPTMFAFITLMFLLNLLFEIGNVDWKAWLAAITFITNYGVSLGLVHANWSSHIWSLCVEEHAYIVLGLTAFLARRFNLQVLLILIALAAGGMINGAVQTWALGLNYYEVYWRSDVHMASIFAGAAMHLFMRSDSAASTLFKHTATTPVFGVVGVLLFVNIVPDPIKYTLGTLCLALSISALPSAYTPVRTMLSRPWILAVGAASYSLYVWQQPFFSTLDGELTLWPKLFQRAWHLVAVIPIAIVSYKFLEGPSRRALNRLWASRTGKTEAHLQEMDAKASSTEI